MSDRPACPFVVHGASSVGVVRFSVTMCCRSLGPYLPVSIIAGSDLRTRLYLTHIPGIGTMCMWRGVPTSLRLGAARRAETQPEPRSASALDTRTAGRDPGRGALRIKPRYDRTWTQHGLLPYSGQDPLPDRTYSTLTTQSLITHTSRRVARPCATAQSISSRAIECPGAR